MDIHFYVYIYIYTCIYTCTHFFQRHKKEMSRSPSYLGLLTWLLGVFALRSDGTRRSVGDMIGTAEAGRDGVTAGQLPWKLFLPRPAFVENLLDDDKSLHTQFPKNLVKGTWKKMVAKDFQRLRNVFFFFFLKGHFRLAYSNDPTTPDYWGPPKKFLEFNFSHGNLRVHPQN